MDVTILQKNYMLVPIAIAVYYASVKFIVPKKDENRLYSTAIVGLIVLAIVYLHKMIPSIEEVITSPPPF